MNFYSLYATGFGITALSMGSIQTLGILVLVGILPLSNRSVNPSEKGACCQVKWNIECVDVISIGFSFL